MMEKINDELTDIGLTNRLTTEPEMKEKNEEHDEGDKE